MPQFSIVIPSFNRAHLIGKTLESILAMEFGDFEIIVVDDGSRDDTEGVVKAFQSPKIQYFRKSNGERGAARNFGAARASGEYVNFFDSDDLVYPNHLTVAHSLIVSVSRPEFFHLGYDIKDDRGNVVGTSDKFDAGSGERILFDNRLSCNGVFLRRDIALQYPFEEDPVLASSEDWELWIRLLCRFPIHFSNVVTSSVVHHDQRSLKTIKPEKIVARDCLLIDLLGKDEAVMRRFGKRFQRFIAERYTFFMLSFSEAGNRQAVLKWGQRAIKAFPQIVFKRRFLASIKNSVFK